MLNNNCGIVYFHLIYNRRNHRLGVSENFKIISSRGISSIISRAFVIPARKGKFLKLNCIQSGRIINCIIINERVINVLIIDTNYIIREKLFLRDGFIAVTTIRDAAA